MKSILSTILPLLGMVPLSLAQNIPAQFLWGESGGQLQRRTTPAISPRDHTTTSHNLARQACTNGPTTRNCWSDGFDINTDYYSSWPNTGKTVSYDLTITNTTCNPDGHGDRVCMLINNQFPGPTLYADWGDTLSVTIHNHLQNNGTSMHWHGLRQLNSNTQDGVNGVTECALAPQDSKTYTFQLTEYGTTWYHSHFSVQYGDGVLGAIVVNGPASANYDIDLGSYTVQDWYYITAFQGELVAALGGAPPEGDNILMNGTNKDANGNGAYDTVTLTPGKKHRLKLINTSIDSQLIVSLDNHQLEVISTDFVPITPYNTTWLNIGIGQRYDVIITANETSDNYWFRALPNGDCQSTNNGQGLAIFSYSDATAGDPTTTASPAPAGNGCVNKATSPIVSLDVPSNAFTTQVQSLPVNFGPVVTNGQNLVLWTVNGSSMRIDWGTPTLQYVMDGNSSYPPSYNVIDVPQANQWTYWIIQQGTGAPPIAHPIHLHGHDFWVLGNGTGTFDPSVTSSLNFNNPPRRDVAFLPGGGWLVLAYPSDNPGAWLMHCHIAFHVSMGLSVQFLERKSEIQLPATNSQWEQNCQNWHAYEAEPPTYRQDDSGLKRSTLL